MKACDTMRCRGFTLIEMMTVLAIFGLVAVYVGRILIVNERAYHTVEQTSESQQNLRLIGQVIDDQIRHAGMMVSRDAAVCGVDVTNGPDTLYVSDAGAIDPQDDFDPYDGADVTSGQTNLTVGSNITLTLGSLVIEPSPPSRPAYDTDGDGVLDSDFRVGAGVIVVDLDAPGRGVACGRVRAVNVGASSITVLGVAAMTAGAGTNLIAVPANEYRIEASQLLMNGMPLARGIEDFQVAYIFDFDGDNVIDVGETRGDGVGAAYSAGERPGNELRELRIGLVSRARVQDGEFVGRPQALLNRAAIATEDGFRRRAHETRIRLRNLASRIDT